MVTKPRVLVDILWWPSSNEYIFLQSVDEIITIRTTLAIRIRATRAKRFRFRRFGLSGSILLGHHIINSAVSFFVLFALLRNMNKENVSLLNN